MRTQFQQGGLLRIVSPFGADDLLLDRVEGSEGISEPFRFHLTMRSGSTALDPAAAIGKEMNVTIAAPGGANRHLGGVVARFVQTGQDHDFAVYEAELVPTLWLLTLARDRRIYANQTTDAIVCDVLAQFGVQYDSKLAGTYPQRDYCVQYDETAFDFVARLMEHAGIAYYFTFDASGHRMVLADDPAHFAECAGGAALRYWPGTGLTQPGDAVTRFVHEHRLVTREATVSDYDFRTPDTSLEGSGTGDAGKGAIYEFAGGQTTVAQAQALARLRVEAAQVDARALHGDSNCQAVAAGTRFTLSGHFVPALNGAFVLRRVHHVAHGGGYQNTFEAFPAAVPFRPAVVTPRPRATGCETAVVVGPDGEEIWTDRHGRVKVRFPWDRGAADPERAPWVRVAQPAAGSGFGALFLPRVGHEVVIAYVDGDPDRPLVTGCVYNGNNTTPAALPADQTQTILRTRSSKEGTAGNELRFEDKKRCRTAVSARAKGHADGDRERADHHRAQGRAGAHAGGGRPHGRTEEGQRNAHGGRQARRDGERRRDACERRGVHAYGERRLRADGGRQPDDHGDGRAEAGDEGCAGAGGGAGAVGEGRHGARLRGGHRPDEQGRQGAAAQRGPEDRK